MQTKNELNNQEAFYQWLIKSGKNDNYANMVIDSFQRISLYAINKKISKFNVFELNTEKDVNLFYNNILSYKLFRIMHKDLHKFILKNGKLYTFFLKENHNNSSNSSNKTNMSVEGMNVIIDSDADKDYFERFPNEYRKIFVALAGNDKKAYLTLEQVAEKADVHIDIANEVLLQVSWAERLGNGYILGKNSSKNNAITLNVKDAYAEKSDVAKVLISAFKRGYRPGSIMDRKRFINIFEEQYGIQIDEDVANQRIVALCFRFDGRYFLPMALVDEITANEIVQYIEAYFAEKEILYYNSLFDQFKDRFNSLIYSAEMLCEYLKMVIKGTKLFYSEKFFSYNANAKSDVMTEVKNYLVEAGKPCSYDEIYAALSHYTKKDIYAVLHYNSPDILGNSKSEYFHVSISGVTKNDVSDIAEICNSLLKYSKYITCNEVVEKLHQEKADLYDSLTEKFSSLGVRRILTYYLRKYFDVMTGVITPKGKQLTIAEVFADFASSRARFTVADIQDFADNYIGTVPYWISIYDNSVRVNQTDFVSEQTIEFDISQIDTAIANYCETYIPLSDIADFKLFPVCGFPWNSYLLQHYVYRFSHDYKLETLGFGKTGVSGFIVKKDLMNSSFEELVIDMLARTKIIYKDEALDYLCSKGVITDRRYKKVEQLLKQAIINRG